MDDNLRVSYPYVEIHGLVHLPSCYDSSNPCEDVGGFVSCIRLEHRTGGRRIYEKTYNAVKFMKHGHLC
jgi:hypothetical protein